MHAVCELEAQGEEEPVQLARGDPEGLPDDEAHAVTDQVTVLGGEPVGQDVRDGEPEALRVDHAEARAEKEPEAQEVREGLEDTVGVVEGEEEGEEAPLGEPLPVPHTVPDSVREGEAQPDGVPLFDAVGDAEAHVEGGGVAEKEGEAHSEGEPEAVVEEDAEAQGEADAERVSTSEPVVHMLAVALVEGVSPYKLAVEAPLALGGASVAVKGEGEPLPVAQLDALGKPLALAASGERVGVYVEENVTEAQEEAVWVALAHPDALPLPQLECVIEGDCEMEALPLKKCDEVGG